MIKLLAGKEQRKTPTSVKKAFCRERYMDLNTIQLGKIVELLAKMLDKLYKMLEKQDTMPEKGFNDWKNRCNENYDLDAWDGYITRLVEANQIRII